MQITQCIASKQGLYNNIVINFDDTVTIIYGANESGKTLLATAMIDLIWGKLSTRSLLEDNTWKNLNISVAVKIDNNHYRFTKNEQYSFILAHSEQADQSKIFSRLNDNSKSIDLNQMIKQCPEIKSWHLYQYLSELNSEIINNTSFIHSPINADAKNILKKNFLQNIILQDKSNFYKTYSFFKKCSEEKKHSLQIDNALIKNILTTENRIKEIKKKIQILELKESKDIKITKEKYQNQKQIKKLQKEIVKLSEKKETANSVQSKINSLMQLKKQVNDLKTEIEKEKDTRFEIKNKVANLKKIFTNFDNFTKLKKNVLDTIQDAYNSVRDINDKINQFYINIDYNRKKLQKNIIFLTIFSVIPFIIQNTTKIIPLPFRMQTIISTGLFIFCLLLIVIKLIIFAIGNNKKSLTWLQKEKEARENKLYEILQKNSIPFDKSIMNEIYEYLLQYFEEYSSFAEHNDEVEEIKNTLKGEDYFKLKKEELKESLNHVKATTYTLKKEIQKLDKKPYANIDEFPIDLVISEINENIDKKNEELKKLKQNVEIISEKLSEEPGNVSKKLKNVYKENKDELKRLQDFQKAVDLIQHSFDSAAVKREETQLNKFADLISKNFNLLTDNNYLLKLNHEDYLELIKTGHCSKISNPAITHLFNLAIKISLSDFFLDANCLPPLIIDEPAIFMDKNRLGNFINLIKEYSKKRQIIILTHDLYSYKNLGKYINL